MLDIQVDSLSVRPAKESWELEASASILGDMSTLLPHAMVVPDRWVLLWDVSNLKVSATNEIIVLCANSDSFAKSEYSHSSGDTPIGAAVLYPVSRDTGLCSAVPSNIIVSPMTTLHSAIIVKG